MWEQFGPLGKWFSKKSGLADKLYSALHIVVEMFKFHLHPDRPCCPETMGKISLKAKRDMHWLGQVDQTPE